jgi:hypothetical protein
MAETLIGLMLAGAASVLVCMLIVVGVARSLDGTRDKQQEQARQLFVTLANRARNAAADQAASGTRSLLTGSLTGLAAIMSDAAAKSGGPGDAADEKDGSPKSRKRQAAFTGFAVAAGLIMLVVGIITGDG